MARLTSDEAKLLKRLQQKAEAPDAPSASRALNISIDLGDEKQVERATKLGLLDALTGDDDETDDEDDDEDAQTDVEDTPRRRGYFDKDE
jgi:hypothetical protein